MTHEAVLRRDDISEFITKLYEGDLHAKRVLSLANATLGVLTSASLAVHAIGQGLAQAMGKLSKHGIKQVDRLLSNEAIDVETFFGYWVAYMVGARVEIVVALDWASFARDGHETIVLSMLTGHGRATPLMWRTVQASTLKGNQRRYEDELLRAMREAMPAGVKVTVVADRGFGNAHYVADWHAHGGAAVHEAAQFPFRRQTEADLKAAWWKLLVREGPAPSVARGALPGRCAHGGGAGAGCGACRGPCAAPCRAQARGDVDAPAAARRDAHREGVAGPADAEIQSANRAIVTLGTEDMTAKRMSVTFIGRLYQHGYEEPWERIAD